MQALEIVQFFFCGAGLTLSPQNHAEIVVGLLKIRLELDRTLESHNRPGQVASGFELHTEVILCLGILRIQLDRLAEMDQSIALFI